MAKHFGDSFNALKALFVVAGRIAGNHKIHKALATEACAKESAENSEEIKGKAAEADIVKAKNTEAIVVRIFRTC